MDRIGNQESVETQTAVATGRDSNYTFRGNEDSLCPLYEKFVSRCMNKPTTPETFWPKNTVVILHLAPFMQLGIYTF